MSENPANVSERTTLYAKVEAGQRMAAAGDLVRAHGLQGRAESVALVNSDPIYDAILDISHARGDRMVLVTLVPESG